MVDYIVTVVVLVNCFTFVVKIDFIGVIPCCCLFPAGFDIFSDGSLS